MSLDFSNKVYCRKEKKSCGLTVKRHTPAKKNEGQLTPELTEMFRVFLLSNACEKNESYTYSEVISVEKKNIYIYFCIH